MAGGRKAKSDEEMWFDLQLGQKICAARRKLGMTQSQLAAELGIGRQRLYWYETGRSAMPAQVLQRVARTLGLSTTVLMRD